MAVQAALTGHLVLSTLHTNDAPSAITRLLDLGVAPYLLKSTLIGVMAQRLVRTLCDQCKGPGDPVGEDDWQALIRPFRAPRPTRGWKPVGCMACRMTGYRGRTGLYELLAIDEALRGLVTDHLDLDAVRRKAMQAGLKPLRLAGAQKIAAGLTTLEEVLKAAPPIEA
jgi:general secretion pathway protein E